MYIYKKEHNRQQADDWLWDTISNNLPLGLKPISAVSNTYLWLVVVELLHRNGFSEWVSQVLFLVDLLKVDDSQTFIPDNVGTSFSIKRMSSTYNTRNTTTRPLAYL